MRRGLDLEDRIIKVWARLACPILGVSAPEMETIAGFAPWTSPIETESS
jgi:hypothetical protein